MSGTGRPLRFLGWLIGGWVTLRAAMLMPPALRVEAPPQARAAALPSARLPSPRTRLVARIRTVWVVAAAGEGAPPSGRAASLPAQAWPGREYASPAMGMEREFPVSSQQALARHDGHAGAPPAFMPHPSARGAGARRWSGTAWLLWRPESEGGRVQAPLLGGSQAGVRLDYRLAEGAAGRLGVYARASRALAGASAEEGALGLAWQPRGLPVSLLAERRQRLGPGGRSDFALIAAGGLAPRTIAPGLEADGYVQAGIVGLGELNGFADGRASLLARLPVPVAGNTALLVGATLSASVQPGAERIDIGPELRLRLPAGAGAIRLSAEWRARIAGRARPSHGPAITLVSDF